MLFLCFLEVPQEQHGFNQNPETNTTFTPEYNSGPVEPDELKDVQCPIRMEDRVRNYTGIQCVFASLECLGRHAQCQELINPPLTSRSECKSYSSPSDSSKKLTTFKVNFELSYQNRQQGIELIKRAMAEHRGCLWGVPGHAMVLCHYDEDKDIVKWIDNSDKSLRIQTTTVEKFKQRWDSWITVIYANPDLLPWKVRGYAGLLFVFDRNNPQGDYKKGYIVFPKR